MIKSCRLPENIIILFYWTAPKGAVLYSERKHFHPFRHLTFILFSTLVKISVRNENAFFGKQVLPKKAKERMIMSNSNNNQINIPQAREAMDRFKMQAAQEVGVNLTNGYNGHLTSREAGSVGGQMVKKMIEAYEQNMQ